jgi:type I restriction enzyme S subunit
LEEMAQTIYREWFVNFRYPGHEDVPLVDSELGPIPEGWNWVALREICDEVKTSVDPESIDPDVPYVGLEHMPQGSIALSEWGYAAAAGSRKLRFQPGDVLFGKIRPYFHKVVVTQIDGICSTDAIVVRPKRQEWFGLTVATMSSVPFVAQAVQTSQGTKMPRANWGVLERYPIAVTTGEVADRFNALVVDTVALIHSLVATNRSLRSTRDLLLPRLISGEVDVSGLDIDVGELVT